jgi:hypothetical protein
MSHISTTRYSIKTGHAILSKYQQKLVPTEPKRRETQTSSYVSPLALSSTRKALINASVVSFSKKSSEASASASDKSTRFISDSINCIPTTTTNKKLKNPNTPLLKDKSQIHTLLKDLIGGVELSETVTGKAETRVVVAKFLRCLV